MCAASNKLLHFWGWFQVDVCVRVTPWKLKLPNFPLTENITLWQLERVVLPEPGPMINSSGNSNCVYHHKIKTAWENTRSLTKCKKLTKQRTMRLHPRHSRIDELLGLSRGKKAWPVPGIPRRSRRRGDVPSQENFLQCGGWDAGAAVTAGAEAWRPVELRAPVRKTHYRYTHVCTRGTDGRTMRAWWWINEYVRL